MKNILITANITDCFAFINFEKARTILLSDVIVNTAVLRNTSLFLLNHIAILENLNFTDN